MLNFPVPYPDELLYSTVARAGVHFGITSPKQLLDVVFKDRMVIATADIPSHIQAISDQFPDSLDLTVENLAYKHTLFPLYAPFVPESRRLQVLEQIKQGTKGVVHHALGVTASLVHKKQYFRICPECMEEQLAKYGEYFWTRQWQAAGCKFCLKHAELSSTKYLLHSYHRHEFVALAPTIECLPPRSNSPPYDKRIERRVRELLDLPPMPSPSFEQWNRLYAQVAHEAGISRNSKVIYDRLKHITLSAWPSSRLLELGIPVTDSQSNWLRLFMRKHRKAFSFLQHIVVLEALLGSKWNFLDVLSQARRQVAQKCVSPRSTTQKPSPLTLQSRRTAWLKLVKALGTRKARLSGGDYLYTWLYRNDRSWLMEINKRYRRTTRSENRRVDWNERDESLYEKLVAIHRDNSGNLDSPRRSKNWYLAQAGCRHLSRKLEKLPLVAAFLNGNSEDVANYQIRRIIRVIQAYETPHVKLQLWELLRLSGLSDQRMKQRTRKFLRQTGWPA